MQRRLIRNLGGELLFADLFPTGLAAIFAFVLMRKDYSGFCIKVRRSSNDEELDVGFVDGVLNVAAINTFCSTNDGFLSIKYDQSIIGNHQRQTDLTKQPKIYDGTTGIMLLDGMTAANYSTSNVMTLDSALTIGSVFTIYNSIANQQINYIFGLDAGTGVSVRGSHPAAGGLSIFGSSSYVNLGDTESASRKLMNVVNISPNSKLANNGDSLTSFSYVGTCGVENIGNRYASLSTAAALNGNIQFEVYYTSDQTSNLAAIRTYINNIYSVY
tara:strand:+ start:240 stop:1055 length:816 start_codon:yes stop_codon:yes gene_type:complete